MLKTFGKSFLFGALCLAVLLAGSSQGMGSANNSCYTLIKNDQFKDSVKKILFTLRDFELVTIDNTCIAQFGGGNIDLPFKRAGQSGVVTKIVSLTPHSITSDSPYPYTFQGEVPLENGDSSGNHVGTSSLFAINLPPNPSGAAFNIKDGFLCGSIISPSQGGWSFIEPLANFQILTNELFTPADTINTYIVYNVKDMAFKIGGPEPGKDLDVSNPLGNALNISAGLKTTPDFDGTIDLDYLADKELTKFLDVNQVNQWQDRVLCWTNAVDLIYHKFNYAHHSNHGFKVHTNVKTLELSREPNVTGYFKNATRNALLPNEHPGKLIVTGGLEAKPLIIPGSEVTEREKDVTVPIYFDPTGLAAGQTTIKGFNITISLYPAAGARAVADVRFVKIVQATTSSTCTDGSTTGAGLTCTFYKTGLDPKKIDISKVTVEATGMNILVTKPLTKLADITFHGNAEGSNAVQVDVNCPPVSDMACLSFIPIGISGSGIDSTGTSKVCPSFTRILNPSPCRIVFTNSILGNGGIIDLDVAQSFNRLESDAQYREDETQIRPYGTLMVVAPGKLDDGTAPDKNASVEIVPTVPNSYNTAIVDIGDETTPTSLSFDVVNAPGELSMYKVRVSMLWPEIAEFNNVGFFELTTANTKATFDCNNLRLSKSDMQSLLLGPDGLNGCQEKPDLIQTLSAKFGDVNGENPEPFDFSFVDLEAGNGTDSVGDHSLLAQLKVKGTHRGSTLVLVETDYTNALNLLCSSEQRTSGNHVGIVHFLTGHDMVKMSHTEMGDAFGPFPGKNVDFVGIADGIGGIGISREGPTRSVCGKVDDKYGTPNMKDHPAQYSLTQHSPNVNALGSSYQSLLGIQVILMAHEIGHNLNASHDDTNGVLMTVSSSIVSGYSGHPIMSSTLDENVIPLFSDNSTRVINNCANDFKKPAIPICSVENP
ncbi:hypothetical protein HY229_09485 [Candidatus Acetothermia bacterium]|nr:hypothetical protein [Candidatus Acetothermia bacterium]MBI3644315.1 hypothetical protein [Candidatus Acetothermia bacterium]